MSAAPRSPAGAPLRVRAAVVGVFFLLPLLAMLEFPPAASAAAAALGGLDARSAADPDLVGRDRRSRSSWRCSPCVLMLVLLVPTMIWVRLRLPRAAPARRVPLPAAADHPGDRAGRRPRPVYAWVTYFLGDSPLTLTFAYIVLVLPYAYRAIDAGLSAIDVVTLAEAARSLGAGWAT